MFLETGATLTDRHTEQQAVASLVSSLFKNNLNKITIQLRPRAKTFALHALCTQIFTTTMSQGFGMYILGRYKRDGDNGEIRRSRPPT